MVKGDTRFFQIKDKNHRRIYVEGTSTSFKAGPTSSLHPKTDTSSARLLVCKMMGDQNKLQL